MTLDLYKGKYYKGCLSGNTSKLILDIRERKVIPSLTHMVYSFDNNLVEMAIKERRRVFDILKDKEITPRTYLGKLRNEQTIGVAFMYYSPRSILGDGVGMGKTVEISALLNLLHQKKELKKFLIAVELSAVEQVTKELVRCTGLSIVSVQSTGAKLAKELLSVDWDKVDGLVVSHSKLTSEQLNVFLANDLDEKGKSRYINTFILDESSVVKNKHTQIYRSVKALCNIVDRVHFLNATVFEIDIQDVYNQLDLIAPGTLPKWWKIEKEFCCIQSLPIWTKQFGRAKKFIKREIVGYKKEEVFKERIGLYYIGRSVEHLTSNNKYKVIEVTPSQKQLHALKKGERYTAVLNCPSLIKGLDIDMNISDVPKLKKLLELIEQREGKSIFVYCFNLEAQEAISDILTKQGKKVSILNGNTNRDDREIITREFNNKQIDVLISNIQRSLNLHIGDTCIYYNLEGNPARMEQIRGRIDRHIDSKEKEFILLIYKDSEEYNWLLNKSRQRSEAASNLTVATKSAVDNFINSMVESGQIKER